MTDKNLLGDIKSSIETMQDQMQETYKQLADIRLVGYSEDRSVSVTMTATYTFEDIDFDERALQGGVKEFKRRINEAWKDLSEKIQQTTQSQTMELLKGMEIPDEIRQISSDEEDKG
mgnify:CR=1 FL=1